MANRTIDSTTNNVLNNKTERNGFIDFLRGVLILLVVIAHVIQYSIKSGECFQFKGFQFIYSFHMPLFMLISGFLMYFSLSSRDFTYLIKTRLKTLGIPILTIGACGAILATLYNCLRAGTSFPLNPFRYLFSLWFITDLFLFSMTAILATYLGKKKKWLKYLVYILAVPLFMLIPEHREHIMYLYPFFIVGLLVNKYHLFDKMKKSLYFYIMSWIITIVLLIYFNHDTFIYFSGFSALVFHDGGFFPEMIGKQLYIDVYRFVIGLSASYAVTVTLEYIYKYIKDKKVSKYIAHFGTISLEIYALQHYFVEMVYFILFTKLYNWLGSFYPVDNHIVLYGIYSPIVGILFVILLSLIVKLMKKMKLSFVAFGR